MDEIEVKKDILKFQYNNLSSDPRNKTAPRILRHQTLGESTTVLDRTLNTILTGNNGKRRSYFKPNVFDKDSSSSNTYRLTANNETLRKSKPTPLRSKRLQVGKKLKRYKTCNMDFKLESPHDILNSLGNSTITNLNINININSTKRKNSILVNPEHIIKEQDTFNTFHEKHPNRKIRYSLYFNH